jgi:hypothetical protein
MVKYPSIANAGLIANSTASALFCQMNEKGHVKVSISDPGGLRVVVAHSLNPVGRQSFNLLAQCDKPIATELQSVVVCPCQEGQSKPIRWSAPELMHVAITSDRRPVETLPLTPSIRIDGNGKGHVHNGRCLFAKAPVRRIGS